MTRKLSSAEPQIARYKPHIARYRLPLEEDAIKNGGQNIEIPGRVAVTKPGKATGALYHAYTQQEKRLVLSSKDDKDIENVLYMKKLASEDFGFELTPYGPKLYARDDNGVSKLDVLMYPFYFLELTTQRAKEVYPKLGKLSLFYHRIYVMLADSVIPTLESLSATLLGKIHVGEIEGRLFFGRSDSIDPNSIDRVRILEK